MRREPAGSPGGDVMVIERPRPRIAVSPLPALVKMWKVESETGWIALRCEQRFDRWICVLRYEDRDRCPSFATETEALLARVDALYPGALVLLRGRDE